MRKEIFLVVVLVLGALGVGYFLGDGGDGSVLFSPQLSPGVAGHSAGQIDWTGFVFPSDVKAQLKGDAGAAGSAGATGASGAAGSGGSGGGMSCSLISECQGQICFVDVPASCRSGVPCYLSAEFINGNNLQGIQGGMYLQGANGQWTMNGVQGINGNHVVDSLFEISVSGLSVGDDIGHKAERDKDKWTISPGASPRKIKLTLCGFS